ncbi:MAG: aminomethyl-transferring glycine dehydrogenase subunit GcvPA [Acidobacteriota bacterium]
MRYLPCNEQDRGEMLRRIGTGSIDDLFKSIPERLLVKGKLQLPEPLSELELVQYMEFLASENKTVKQLVSFLGAGSYNHYIPAAVDHLISRSEFYTSYTPYQPEVSQGTLQAIFEYQTMACMLTGMDVANASLYDGGTALAEGILMASRVANRKKILVSSLIHPEYLRVVRTYINNLDLDLQTVSHGMDGRIDLDELEKNIDRETFAIAIQNPNFFGCIEKIDRVAKIASDKEILLIVSTPEAFSFGILRSPGELGADIAVGEAQSFGNPMSFGGPYLGFMAAKEKFVRQMPGRLVGETVDADGKRGFVLTLSTREQHIRREKATSNICTNEGLCALSAAIHMALLGRKGLMEIARLNMLKTALAKQMLSEVPGCYIPFSAPVFNEFVLELPVEAGVISDRMLEHGFIAGLPMKPFFPEMENCLLLCFTEMNSKIEIERFREILERII